jgi:hypothetical protein
MSTSTSLFLVRVFTLSFSFYLCFNCTVHSKLTPIQPVATRLRAARPGFDYRQGRFLSSPQRPDWLWGQPASYPMGTGGRGVKRSLCEVNHSPSSSAKIKNVWSYTFTPPYVCMAWCLVKYQGRIYFYLYCSLGLIHMGPICVIYLPSVIFIFIECMYVLSQVTCF